jgi:hypothetical protein
VAYTLAWGESRGPLGNPPQPLDLTHNPSVVMARIGRLAAGHAAGRRLDRRIEHDHVALLVDGR